MQHQHHNNIGLIRLMLAVVVIASHSYQLCLGREISDPLFVLSDGQASGGSLAVNLFFLLSGYLISKSWLASQSAEDYLRKRVLRILPGYFVALCLSVSIAAAFTSHGPIAYLRGLAGRNDQLLRSVLLLQNPNRALDDDRAFSGNAYPGAVNHSLWTLEPELFCYALLAGAGCLHLLSRRYVLLVFCILAHFGFAVNLMRFGGADATLWRFITFFGYGIGFFLFRDKVSLRSPSLVALSVAVLLIGLPFAPWFSLFLPTAGGYLLFAIAFATWTPFSRLFADVDLSYGMYVYAWPIQQACVSLFEIQTPAILFVVSVPAVAIVSWGSWTFVERPFLRSKSKIQGEAPRRGPAIESVAPI